MDLHFSITLKYYAQVAPEHDHWSIRLNDEVVKHLQQCRQKGCSAPGQILELTWTPVGRFTAPSTDIP